MCSPEGNFWLIFCYTMKWLFFLYFFMFVRSPTFLSGFYNYQNTSLNISISLWSKFGQIYLFFHKVPHINVLTAILIDWFYYIALQCIFDITVNCLKQNKLLQANSSKEWNSWGMFHFYRSWDHHLLYQKQRTKVLCKIRNCWAIITV